MSAILLVVQLIYSSDHLSALPVNCSLRNQGVQSYQDLIHRVREINSPDRRTEEEFARENNLTLRELRAKTGATGKLKCGTDELTAQLTAGSNIITTAAHAFTDENCVNVNAPSSCEFSGTGENGPFRVRVKRLIKSGHDRCPAKLSSFDDWAVAELADAVEGVAPYNLPREGQALSEGEPVVFVGALSADFVRRDRSGRVTNPRHVGRCSIQKTFMHRNAPLLYMSDCDTGVGSSGGAILTSDLNQRTLMAIHILSNESAAESEAAGRRGRPNRCQFDPKTCLNGHVPVSGEFLRAIEDAVKRVGQPGTPQGISI